jgi:hypothetical protein
MSDNRPSKDECLDGFDDSVGVVGDLSADRFPETDVFEPSDRIPRAAADRVVDDRAGLLEALRSHDPGAVVWVDGDIDVGDAEGVELRDVTLAGGHGLADEPTSTLRTETKPRPLFEAGDDVRITGLRLHGDEFEFFDPADRYPDVEKPIYKVGASTGVEVTGDDVELDNLEAAGWTYAGIVVDRSGRDDVRTHVHHADLVDNPAESLGYGVTASEGRPLVELCYFDNNRHSVAGVGGRHCGYVLRYCVVGDHHSSHAIDMHGASHDGDGPPIAGRRTQIYNNVVKQRRNPYKGHPRNAVKFRGRPIERSSVTGNWFFHETDRVDNETHEVAVRQTCAPRHSFDNLEVSDNVYGTDRSAEEFDLREGATQSVTQTPAQSGGSKGGGPKRRGAGDSGSDEGASSRSSGSSGSSLVSLAKRLFGG